ncbi:hypothetical protein MMC07_006087 [Pseudocyphellaria aurata]|nr:hypothetical protein [Pseudocyphellaria aurata]
MLKTTFATLPAEIHVGIAQCCGHDDLYNLCLTSKSLNERCLSVLYRDVDLVRDEPRSYSSGNADAFLALDALKRQQQFVRTLRSRPEYAKHVRFLKMTLYTPSPTYASLRKNKIPDQELWRVVMSLVHVESVAIGIRIGCLYLMTVPSTQIPTLLFQSATSVTLVGQMQYSLAKAILNAINPATLKHLNLDVVRDGQIGHLRHGYVPGKVAEDGRIIASGTMTGLLTALTGRCTALQTLVLRRIGQYKVNYTASDEAIWNVVAEETSYTEWAQFIRSVQGTVEKLGFEQADLMVLGGRYNYAAPYWWEPPAFRVMDQRFEKLVLPTLVSGNWPCLTSLKLRGVVGSRRLGGVAGLKARLKAVRGETTSITVDPVAYYVEDTR